MWKKLQLTWSIWIMDNFDKILYNWHNPFRWTYFIQQFFLLFSLQCYLSKLMIDFIYLESNYLMTPCDPSRPFVTPPISMISVTIRVSSERSVSRKNEKIFGRISQILFRGTDWSEISRKKRKFSHFSRANEIRKWSEMVAKKFFFANNWKFFLFAGNPSDNFLKHL